MNLKCTYGFSTLTVKNKGTTRKSIYLNSIQRSPVQGFSLVAQGKLYHLVEWYSPPLHSSVQIRKNISCRSCNMS